MGLARAGHETVLLCENDPGASRVLEEHFPGVRNVGDIRELRSLPPATTLLTGGFPCQDLSQAGATKGIEGRNSGLVDHVFRLLKRKRVPWVLLENVSFMLQLEKGAGVRHLATQFERLGYRWAYRTVDSRAFGVPQRRKRVFFLAALHEDPAPILFSDEAGPPLPEDHTGKPCGFYWTEGVRGLGWAVDSIPTLKGGSTIGIPSPPAVWMPDGRIVTPSITAAEQLQGFDAGWTETASEVTRKSHRWKLVGNAVTVDAAEWIGRSLVKRPTSHNLLANEYLHTDRSWQPAGALIDGERLAVRASHFPIRYPTPSLTRYLDDAVPLSHRAVAGFNKRLFNSRLRYPAEFGEALRDHERATAEG